MEDLKESPTSRSIGWMADASCMHAWPPGSIESGSSLDLSLIPDSPKHPPERSSSALAARHMHHAHAWCKRRAPAPDSGTAAWRRVARGP
jgi:hypothetical protein